MKTIVKSQRIHSLDSLRAIMMLLGLVIHSAITYGVIDYGDAWSIKDANSTSLINDYIVFFIHAFRMQIFFLVAGFFGAMLFYERKPLKMVRNRVARIVLPFAVFVILLWPTILFGFNYTAAVFAGDSAALSQTLALFSDLSAFIPSITFHLWFLYYLAIITFVSVIIILILERLTTISFYVQKVFKWIFGKVLFRILFFAGITAIGYFVMGTSQVATSTSFVPDFNTFLYYFIFYIIGWFLYKSKEHLQSFMSYDWLSTMIAIGFFSIYFFLGDTLSYSVVIILKSIMVWLFIFGISGLFIRYTSNHSPIMRYVSDSSYWVYLVHLTFTAILPSLIADWAIPAVIKFLIILSSTTVICFASYHFLVRGSFIGKFLNGRRYSKKLSDIKSDNKTSVITPVTSGISA